MTNYDLSLDLKVLLKDSFLKNDTLFIKFKAYNLTKSDAVEELKMVWYKMYNRSNIPSYAIKEPNRKLVSEYIEILKNVEKPNDSNSWYIKNLVSNTSVRTQRGFSEKLFSNNGFNPTIEKFVLSEGEVVSFEYPYYYLKDGYFWLLAQNLLTITNDELFRFYFNLKGDNLEGISILFRFLLNEFDTRNISYRAKLPINNNQFGRADNFVLYIDKIHLNMAIDLIHDLEKDIAIYLRDEIPLFTKEIFKGVGFAEEPLDNTNQSFGKNKISQIIRVLDSKKTQNLKLDSTTLVSQIQAKIQEKFYLNKSSFYKNSIETFLISEKKIVTKKNLDARPRSDVEKGLQNIIYQLNSSAIIYEPNHINWLVGNRNFKDLIHTDRVVLKKTKTNFYDGKLGIGWLLANAYQFSQDFAILKTCKFLKEELLKKLESSSNFFETVYYLLETEKIFIKNLKKDEIDYYGILEETLKASIAEKINNFELEPENISTEILWFLEVLLTNVESLKLGNKPNLNSQILSKLSTFFNSIFGSPDPSTKIENSLIVIFCLCEKAILLGRVGLEGFDRKAGEYLKSKLNPLSSPSNLVENIILINAINSLLRGPELRDILKSRLDKYLEIFHQNQFFPQSISASSDGILSISASLDGILMSLYIKEINTQLKYPNQNLLISISDDYLRNLSHNFLKENIFPDLGLSRDFYNPGLNKGIAGVGYLLLFLLQKKDDIILLPSQCFLDCQVLQFPKKAHGAGGWTHPVFGDFVVHPKGNQSGTDKIGVASKFLL